MERLEIDQDRVDYWRAYYRAEPGYTEYEEPAPDSVLKLDDDVLWIDAFPCRVVWGTDNPAVFLAYCPDIFGDMPVPLETDYITDRAPVDPDDVPAMPIYQEGEGEVPP